MTGPFFLGTFCRKPAIVDKDGLPIPREASILFLRAITETHWDLSHGQIEIAKIEMERERKGGRR